MENSLSPAFVKIDYHSAFGSHTMTIPTKDWNASPSVGGAGAFDDYVGGTVDADAMINALVDLFLPFFKADTTFDVYTIYTQASPTDPAFPVASKAIGSVGTNATTTWSKAVQTTFSIRTDSFGQMKIVFLDAPSGGVFDKVSTFGASPEAVAVMAELADIANGWAGRDGGKPGVLTQIAYTLNEKLRREYNMN